ncbi:MAG: hypothetical protein EOO74_01850 [Myxococcales bacterium]|nr:MAG: hypothetical protein EOO74_01850 [Myxococcales bacterium]
MSAPAGYCDLCDLELAYCPHGRPKPEPAAAPPPKPRATRATSTSSAARRTSSQPAVSVRTKPRRWTPAEEFAAAIIVVLTDAGGELPRAAALEALEELVGDRLTEGDRQRGPTGELRWHLAARKARQSLVADGQMVNTTPGFWTLA